MANANLTIGRVGLDVVDNAEVEAYPNLSFEGDRLSFSGDLLADTTNGARILRRQLNGYGPHNTDEPVIPVTWSVDPSIDGFYFPVSTEVSDRAHGSYIDGRGMFAFDVELQRVEAWSAPAVEKIVKTAIRANSNSYATTSLRPTLTFPDPGSGGAFGFDLVTTSTGDVTISPAAGYLTASGESLEALASAGSQKLMDCSPQWRIGPAAYYWGSPAVTDSNDAVVVGRQMPNSARSWSIENGLVRVEPGSTNGVLVVSHWDGSAWDATEYTLLPTSRNFSHFETVTVLTNRPEWCSIRLTWRVGTLGADALDIGLGRGDQFAQFRRRNGSITADTNGVKLSTAQAGVALDTNMGITAAATDTNGNRYVIASPHTTTPDFTNGSITTSTQTVEMHWMIGAWVNHPSGTNSDDSRNLVQRYMPANMHGVENVITG